MSDFLKKFLLEDPRRFNPSGRFVAVAAFGKHPGWDDHVEDLGLETESLNFAKLLLYVNGIGGQIDSGAWEKLEPAQQVPAFNHLFVWQRSGQVLVGRMWSSSDGKGRKRYPMVVCLHFIGVPLGWILKQALPVLAELEQGCVQTTSAADVRSLLARKRAALREAVQAADGRGENTPVSPEALHRILNPGQNGQEGFLRVLYQIHGQLGAFAPGVFNVRTSPASIRVQQIRVPRAASGVEEALLFWSRFFLVQVDASVPLLLTLPLDADWVDVTVGEPESHELFCLRATPKAVPLVSEVPYKLEEDFRTKATAFLQAFQRGETTRPDLTPASASVAPASAPAKGGWLKWLGVGAIVVLAGAAALFVLPKLSSSSGPVDSKSAKADPLMAATNRQNPGATPPATNQPIVETAQSKADAAAEAARQAEEKKQSEAISAATRLKAEIAAAAKEKDRRAAEAAAEKERQRQLAQAAELENQKRLAQAAKEKERQAAETARVEAEKQAALAKQIAEQNKAAPLADSPAKTQLVSATLATAPAVTTATAHSPDGAPTQMTNSIGMVLVLLPSGLWVGKYEVTQAEYYQVMKTNPSNPKWLNDRQPVQQVTWNDAIEFTRKLTELERSSLPAGKSYSLPTEQQWKEFSAGQTFGELPNGTARRKEPTVVGQSGPPNKLGLFDVLGNLWEWCLDDQPGDQKLLKGGAFNSNDNYDRALPPDAKSLSCGFRCVLASTDNH
ncbi:MAG TPA: SUMF1/EgtB/PvdO family nonheme iron enzyme [Verrucomicrobiae bacterium]|nr:SUMF1/EgtB/PvdO family nonheme iron enzyme [Verrucomicrobiae bacterium]